MKEASKISLFLIFLLISSSAVYSQTATVTVIYGSNTSYGNYQTPKIPDAKDAKVRLWGAGGRGGVYQSGVTGNDNIYFGGGGGGAYTEMNISGTPFDVAAAARSLFVAAGASEQATTFAGSIVANSGKNGFSNSSSGALGGAASASSLSGYTVYSYKGGNGGSGIAYQYPSGGYKGGQGGQSAGLNSVGTVARAGGDGGNGLMSPNYPSDHRNTYMGSGGGGATTYNGADPGDDPTSIPPPVERWPGGGGGGGKTGALGVSQHSAGKGGNGRVQLTFSYPVSTVTPVVSASLPANNCLDNGSSILLELADAGNYSNIEWYRDGIKVAENTGVYTVSTAGSYYVKVQRKALSYTFSNAASLSVSNGGSVITSSGTTLSIQASTVMQSRTIQFVSAAALSVTFKSEYTPTVINGETTAYATTSNAVFNLNTMILSYSGQELLWTDAAGKSLSSTTVTLSKPETTFHVYAINKTAGCESKRYTLKISFFDEAACKTSIWSPNWRQDPRMFSVDSLRNWHDKRNWVKGVVPSAGSTVYIPGYRNTIGLTGVKITHFPYLQNDKTYECKDIYLMYGAEITHPQYLTYERAFVQLDMGLNCRAQDMITQEDLEDLLWGKPYDHPALSATLSGNLQLPRGQWKLLSPGVNGMNLTGDYCFGGAPSTFVRTTDATEPVSGSILRTNWSLPITDNDRLLPTAQGFALWVNHFSDELKHRESGTFNDPYLSEEMREVGLKKINGIVQFPWMEDAKAVEAHRIFHYDGTVVNTPDKLKGQYYSYSGNDLVMKPEAVSVVREKPYQLAFGPKGTMTTSVTVNVVDLHGRKVALIGNPYISTIDFDKFQKHISNSPLLKNGFIRWKEGIFESYGESSLGIHTYFPYITPMEGFFVEFKEHIALGSAQTLIFAANDVCIPHPPTEGEEDYTLYDVDGNSYSIGYFGEAGWWMTENLATTRYADGMKVAELNVTGSDPTKAYLLTSGSVAAPFTLSQSQNSDHYAPGAGKPGLLYSWQAASKGTGAEDAFTSGAPGNAGIIVQGVCPTGWHLPNDFEWSQLEKEIASGTAGMYSHTGETSWNETWKTSNGISNYRGEQGKKMKSPVPTADSPTGGTSAGKDACGFSALLVSSRNYYGQNADFWTASIANTSNAWTRTFSWEKAGVARSEQAKNTTFPIRCKKNRLINCPGDPKQPGVISGIPSAAINLSATFTASVTDDPDVTSYGWTLPSGLSGNSTSNSILITAVTAGTYAAGSIKVKAYNDCAVSAERVTTTTITVNNCSGTPAQPANISGTIVVCSDSEEGTYSIAEVANATSYTWTLPAGWSGSSTTASISATPGASAQSGNITVIASNTCGNSTSRVLAVTVNAKPAAPTASSYSSCSAATIANLSATGSNIKWYSESSGGTALASTTSLSTGTYYASQTVNGCESARVAVSVTIGTPAPSTASSKTFCGSVYTVANLSATGNDIKWYSESSGGTALASSTALSTGTYYASQTVNGCESASRSALSVTVEKNGVSIKAVCWATRNVNSLGSFASSQESFGMFYQWNNKTAWPSSGSVSGWISGWASSTSLWTLNPCPTGWRIPTREEFNLLIDTGVTKTWTKINGINGYRFDYGSISLFLPAAGYRQASNGSIVSQNTEGRYWTREAQNSTSGYYLSLKSGSTSTSVASPHANAFSIRCVK